MMRWFCKTLKGRLLKALWDEPNLSFQLTRQRERVAAGASGKQANCFGFLPRLIIKDWKRNPHERFFLHRRMAEALQPIIPGYLGALNDD
jgi:hypothetical protein